MNGATPETMAEARAVYRVYKAGQFYDQPHSCGHVSRLRSCFDRQLRHISFEHWLSEFGYEARQPCYDCKKVIEAPLLEETGDRKRLPTLEEWLRAGSPMREVQP